MHFNRYQAFGTHLLGSTVVALISAALVFLVWYPVPLSAAMGVTAIFLILLGVDVVIGPVITLIVFDPAKKELRRDLAIVLLLQVSALLYGMHAVFIARPAFVVFNVDRFDVISANDLTEEGLAKAQDPELRNVPLWGPRTIAALRPQSREARNDLMFGALAGGEDLHQKPQYWAQYAPQRTDVVARLQPMEKLRSLNKDDADRVASLESKYAKYPGGIGFLAVKGKVKDLAAIVSRESGQVLEMAPLNPW